jgi:hypothetical protein
MTPTRHRLSGDGVLLAPECSQGGDGVGVGVGGGGGEGGAVGVVLVVPAFEHPVIMEEEGLIGILV